MTNSRRVFHSSESMEWCTPPYIIEAARRAMGTIDLDPASSHGANRTVRAASYYIEEDDGLAQCWHGCVWLNPPYGRGAGNRSNADLWSAKLIDEYRSGRLEQACLLVKAAPSELWFQKLYQYPICFTRGRVAFLDAFGVPIKGNAHGSAIVGVGVASRRFAQSFQSIGAVVGRII